MNEEKIILKIQETYLRKCKILSNRKARRERKREREEGKIKDRSWVEFEGAGRS